MNDLRLIIKNLEPVYNPKPGSTLEHTLTEKELNKALKEDLVNKPSHYTNSKIEVIDYIEDKGFNYNLGNAVKYISRAGKKNKDTYVQDLQKAIWYLTREVNNRLQKPTNEETK
jgi:hypothetical protein